MASLIGRHLSPVVNMPVVRISEAGVSTPTPRILRFPSELSGLFNYLGADFFHV